MRTLKSFKIFLIVFYLVYIVCLTRTFADESDTSGVTMHVPSICKLTINDSIQIMNLLQDASGEAAYEAGHIDGENNKPALIVDSNTGWKLSVKASFDWGIVDGYQKSTSDLQLKVVSNSGHQTGFTNFTPVSLNDQEIASYSAGVGDDIYNGQYRILLDWTKDIPGAYFIIITYTLSTQSA
ncbi:MAG: hypothetical protein ABH815_03805 [Candidatus Omnitrophota bacterium]